MPRPPSASSASSAVIPSRPRYRRSSGSRTIRGVEYRDVGPKLFRDPGNSDSHAPMGGQTLALATAEYTIPVFKAVRFATFIDAGSLGEDAFDPELSDFSVAAGVGIRIDIPTSRSDRWRCDICWMRACAKS